MSIKHITHEATMETRKTSKPSDAKNPDPGENSARKLSRQRMAPEMDRYLLRLGLAGLFDGGSSK